ncbi:MAG TPA: hypothetical protein ENN09_03700, partial [Planctomycetes bacterium]|nr:hypothetical protein [Planctomycetota bacterium]
MMSCVSSRTENGKAAVFAVAAILAVAVLAALHFGLKNRCPFQAAPPAKPAPDGLKTVDMPPGVYLVNKDYNRVASKLLVRRVVEPTLARMDLAAYDANAILIDPKAYEPEPPDAAVPLAELDFDGALEKDTLCNRISQTPLSEEERNNPMAWRPLAAFLAINPDNIDTIELELAGAAVSEVKWNDPNIPQPYQEISTVHLHETPDDYELWAKVEFKPWVKFLKDVDDEDGDGFPEIYGRIRKDAVTPEITDYIIRHYLAKPLTL